MTNDQVLETADADFERDVIQRSYELPVVVDFWATWCGPCRALGPTLEKLAGEAAGGWLLVKAEVERNGAAARQFGVESIPAVFAVREGRIVDGFIGALSEAELRQWLAGIQPSAAERLVAEADQLAANEPRAAEEKLRQAIGLEPNAPAAKIALARLLLAQDRLDESEQFVAELAQRGFLEPEAERLRAEVALRQGAAEAGPVDDCRAALARSPDDLTARWQLARALAGQSPGSREAQTEALDLCLKLLELDRHGLGEQARQLMVNLFHVLGPDDELVTTYRRKLSSVLY